MGKSIDRRWSCWRRFSRRTGKTFDESAEIVMFERGPYVSFSNCCIPFHISGDIEKSESLVLMTPPEFDKQYNIDARVYNEVVAINKEEKTVSVILELTSSMLTLLFL